MFNVYLAEKLAQERETEVKRHAEQRRMLQVACDEAAPISGGRLGRAATRVKRLALAMRPA